MARARNIKPGFFKNEDLAECSLAARLLFPGLWMLADREGRLDDRPKRIKGELFPFDAFDVDPLLDELQRWGFILRYQVAGRKYIQVINFAVHQNPHTTEKDGLIPDQDGYLIVHDRTKTHCVTGTYRKVKAADSASNVNPPLSNVNPPEPNALIHRFTDSLIQKQAGAGRQHGGNTPRAGEAEPGALREPAPDATEPPQNLPSGKNPSPVETAVDPGNGITSRALDIAALLRERGAGVVPGDVRLRRWAETGISDAALLTALETAERRRADAGDLHPVNAGLLDAILADLVSQSTHGPPARASPLARKLAARERYLEQEEAAGKRLGLDDERGAYGRNERDITGIARVVA